MNIPIHQYDAKYVPNPNPKGATPYEEFARVREALYSVCQRFGKTGPDSSREYDCVYWLIDDQWNDDLYQNLEVNGEQGWTEEWFKALIKCLKKYRGWGISIAGVKRGHLLVYGVRILVNGPTFEKCHDLASIVAAAKAAS